MNKKFLVLLATCAVVASSLPLTGCAASKNQNAVLLPTAKTVIEAQMEDAEEPEETEETEATAQRTFAEKKSEKAGVPTLNLTAAKPVSALATKPAAKKPAKKATKKAAEQPAE